MPQNDRMHVRTCNGPVYSNQYLTTSASANSFLRSSNSFHKGSKYDREDSVKRRCDEKSSNVAVADEADVLFHCCKPAPINAMAAKHLMPTQRYEGPCGEESMAAVSLMLFGAKELSSLLIVLLVIVNRNTFVRKCLLLFLLLLVLLLLFDVSRT